MKMKSKKVLLRMNCDKEQYKIKITDAVNQEIASCDDYITGSDFVQFLEEFPIVSDGQGQVMDVFFKMPAKRQESLWIEYWSELCRSCAELIGCMSSQKYDSEIMEQAADEVGPKIAQEKLDLLIGLFKKAEV